MCTSLYPVAQAAQPPPPPYRSGENRVTSSTNELRTPFSTRSSSTVCPYKLCRLGCVGISGGVRKARILSAIEGQSRPNHTRCPSA